MEIRPVQAARETRPLVALLDLTMPGSGGMSALEEIARCCPGTRVLVLSMTLVETMGRF
jgi:two-component system, NarL family, response regulator LiaR